MRFVAVAAALLGLGGPAAADVAISASNNATIQPGGPRTGDNGKKFFNMEGTANGSFSSFGVADFDVSKIKLNPGTPTALSVRLVEENAAFTAPGPINFYLAPNTTTSIDPGTSPLVFNSTSEGVGNQLGTLFPLGTGMFNTTGNTNNGQVDTFNLTLPAGAPAFILSQFGQPGGDLRLVITPGSPAVSATFAGFSFLPPPPNPAPQLTVIGITAVPEPGQLWQAGLGAVAAAGVWAFRRRGRA